MRYHFIHYFSALEAPDTTSTKESLSLSIEETKYVSFHLCLSQKYFLCYFMCYIYSYSKLREKLGLKPLKMDSDSKDG